MFLHQFYWPWYLEVDSLNYDWLVTPHSNLHEVFFKKTVRPRFRYIYWTNFIWNVATLYKNHLELIKKGTALINGYFPKQTKAKSEEHRVQLGRLRCGLRGRLYSSVTPTHPLTHSLTHSLIHSIGQHYGFASMGSSIKNQHLTFLRRRKKYVLKQSWQLPWTNFVHSLTELT